MYLCLSLSLFLCLSLCHQMKLKKRVTKQKEFEEAIHAFLALFLIFYLSLDRPCLGSCTIAQLVLTTAWIISMLIHEMETGILTGGNLPRQRNQR